MEPISKRFCPWLSEEQISLLQSHGIRTFIDFITNDKSFVLAAAGFSPAEYDITMQNIKECIRPEPITARQLAEQADEPLFSTGIEKLDEVLGGGLAGGEVLEIYGKSPSGKTQLALAVAAQFCHFRAEDKRSVVYFDFKNDFRATRFLSFCEGSRTDLAKIQIIRPSNFPELISNIEELYTDVCKVTSNFYAKLKLIIFDSAPLAIYPAANEDPISWRFYEEQFMEKSAQLAQLNNGIIVIFVNHSVTARAEWKSKSGLGSFASKNVQNHKPAMGTYWRHKPNFRLHLSEQSFSSIMFSATLEKSSRTETIKTFEFSVEKDGIKSY